jgi:two-component system response regulator FlrC
LLELAARVARSDSTVLISGESGTGKEVLARYIHQQSPRAAAPFVAINCAAIPDNMLEATLFGHEKGAFTGAIAAQAGKFEQAEGGTLLLDEISEMPWGCRPSCCACCRSARSSAWRAQADRPGYPRGRHHQPRPGGEVAAGRFREDLYYRLSVFPWPGVPARAPGRYPAAGRASAGPPRPQDEACPGALVAQAQACLQAYPGRATCVSWTTRSSAR